MDATTPKELVLDAEGLELLKEEKVAPARENFWYFRQLVDPKLIPSWWQEHAAKHLQWFYDDMVAGKRPKLLLQAPPQHGKSRLLRDFNCWCAGKNPDLNLIFGSYSEDLGVAANLHLQRLISSRCYQSTFQNTRIPNGSDKYICNSQHVEFPNFRGSFRNTTVLGAINGFSLDLGVVDDPIKGQAESRSKTIRDKTWDWFTNDFFLRFSNNAGFVMIQTRWHVDDPTGRWLERFPNTRILRYSAVAESDDWSVKKGLRSPGEALFPQFKSLDFLAERRKALTSSAWEALYQQKPIITGGGIFPVEKLLVVSMFDRHRIKKSVRYWDKAGTQDAGKRTAGVLMHSMWDCGFVIENVVKGQWAASMREERIRACAENDRNMIPRNVVYEVMVEQEPGSGGKESAEYTIKNLQGFRVYADKVTGSKEVRAEPLAAQVQGNNVRLVAGEWIHDFLDEAESYPNGKFLDQIDAAAGAFNRLTAKPSYNLHALAS